MKDKHYMTHLERYFSQDEQKATPLREFANDDRRQTGDRIPHSGPATNGGQGVHE